MVQFAGQTGLEPTENKPPMEKVSWEFINAEEAVVVYQIDIDWHLDLAVIGHPNDATYEWIIWHRDTGEIEGRSNDGYGEPVIALRDGILDHSPVD